MKLYEQLLQVLRQLGVKHIFGVPGDAINPLVEALRKQDHIKFIHVAHEEAGAMAASAQAKLTGRLAVCAGTVGPGAIHLLNGLYDAKKDHAPVLAITGQVPSVELGFSYHQEVDLQRLFSDVAVFRAAVDNPKQMPRIAIEACNAAIHDRGVAVLTIPHDIGSQDVPDADFNLSPTENYSIVPSESKFRQALDMINKASKISILFGEGCRGDSEKLLELAHKLKAPLIYSLKGKDQIPYDNPQVAGGLGLLGTKGGLSASENCDLLLVLGSDFPYRDWYPKHIPIIRVNRDGCVIGRRTPGEFALIGDCKSVIGKLLQLANPKDDDAHLKDVQRAKAHWDKMMDKKANLSRSKNTIHPQAVAKALSSHSAEDAIFTCDTGAVTVWGARHLHLKAGQRFVLSFNLATMAFAMPAAIGAQLMHPHHQVISLSGDGGFNMLMGDFLTAVKYKLPIKVIIFNNSKLGLIKMEQEVEGFPEHETDLLNPDYALLAQSFGAEGVTVTKPDELETALEKALDSSKPFLVDVHVDPDELTMPPKIEIGQAWGFSKAKVKEFFEIED